jgi:osmotically-inducible protein OsmY
MRVRHTPALLLAVCLAAGLVACRGNQSLEGQAKDARIKTQVKSKLAAQVDAGTLTSIEVNVTNGVVTLAGPVHSAEESSRIESVARSVEGVTDVKVTLQILAPQAIVTPAVPPAATPSGAH